MSRRLSLFIMLILIISLFSACDGAQVYPAVSPLPSPAPTHVITKPEQELPAVAISEENARHEELFRSFIDENYDALSAACFGGIAGVGFIDLDLDGCIELLLFDAGASASMGVQFFDVIGGEVQCVSANMLPMAESFGKDHLTDTTVNANYFDDFRLMKDKATGERFFQVVSFNGAADFSYRELIRFGRDGEALTLTPLSYIHEDYDIDTGEVTATEYKLSGLICSEEEYLAALAKTAEEETDTGLEAAGVFLWESSAYSADRAGLLAMTDAALALSRSSMPAA